MLKAMANCRTVTAKILIRRDIAIDWSNKNPVLANGEMGYESDTNRLKIGNGFTSWNALPYYIGNGSGANGILDGGQPNSTYTDQAEIDAGGVI